ncbi:hypothetical protein SNEBB_002428 [Seison nebaliae]|nr:hypothetical protein SNEBB_002428 [Seison nebaliae]
MFNIKFFLFFFAIAIIETMAAPQYNPLPAAASNPISAAAASSSSIFKMQNSEMKNYDNSGTNDDEDNYLVGRNGFELGF